MEIYISISIKLLHDTLLGSGSLSSAQSFVECFSGFAECFRHSAKKLILVVIIFLYSTTKGK
jgi:hypothetical protein